VRVIPAGDFNYEFSDNEYSQIRRPEPHFARKIREALGDAKSLINVGAGTGSYEPVDMSVTPIEPSESMRRQRPPHLAPAIDAVAEDLPFPDKTFDAALASVTVHQWHDLRRGLSELRRVTRGAIVIMTFDPVSLRKFWLAEYAPEMLAHESGRMPDLAQLVALLSTDVHIEALPIPADCADGFAEAYFGRPESFLDAQVRKSQSAWGFITPHEERTSIGRLRSALEDGSWDRRFGTLRSAPEYSGSLRLLKADPE
jgi:SAM-dependent methyltransferase